MKTKLLFLSIIATYLIGCGYERPVSKQTPEQIAKADSISKALMQLDSIAKVREDSIQEAEELKEQKEFEKTKAGKIWKKHPEWSKEDCKALAENKIWIGMEISMVKYLNGTPNSKNVSNYGNGNEYQYCWYNNTPSCYYCGEDGIVTSYN